MLDGVAGRGRPLVEGGHMAKGFSNLKGAAWGWGRIKVMERWVLGSGFKVH